MRCWNRPDLKENTHGALSSHRNLLDRHRRYSPRLAQSFRTSAQSHDVWSRIDGGGHADTRGSFGAVAATATIVRNPFPCSSWDYKSSHAQENIDGRR